VSIDFHRLFEAIDNNRLIIIDYIDHIDCFPMIDFYQLGTAGTLSRGLNNSIKGSNLLSNPFSCRFSRKYGLVNFLNR